MSDLVLGRQYQILTDKQKPIEIVNDQKQKLTVNLTVLNPTYIPMTIDQGYEPGPNPDFISFPKDEITLGPKSRKPVRLFLEIPDEKQYQGKHYLFLVAFRTGEVTSGQQLLRVFVSTAGPEDEKAGVQEPGAHQSTTP